MFGNYIIFFLGNREVKTILTAMQEYHNKTKVQFRPYKETDLNWIQIRGNQTGCWSSVGMQTHGQVITPRR